MFLRRPPYLLAAILSAAPLCAAEAEFGAQVHLARPVGTFADSAHLGSGLGLGLGLNAAFDLGAGHVMRPKLDYLSFRRNTDSTFKAESFLLMADYNYFVAEEREGAYLIAGLGLQSTRQEAADARATRTGLAWNAGLGYAFNRNVAVEVKYLGMDLGDLRSRGALRSAGFMAGSVVGSISFTF